MNLLAELFSSRIRAEVFRLLFDGMGVELHMRELERRSGCAIGTIQTELKKLHRLDLVVSRRDGNRLYYRAKTTHPLYNDLCDLVQKTVGVIGALRACLIDAEAIDCAFVFGSLANDRERADSDIDLMVIGTIGLRLLAAKLAPLAAQCGREINPHVFAPQEFSERIRQGEHFVMTVMAEKKLFMKGGEDDLAKLGGQRVAARSPDQSAGSG